MPVEYSLTDSFLLGLAYMEAYFEKDEDKLNLVQETSSEEGLETPFLLLNVVLFKKYCEEKGITSGELINQLREEINKNDKT